MSIVFFLGLGILPFFWWPWHSIPYEVPKVWFFAGWVELMVVALIVATIRNNLHLATLNKKVWVVVGLWLGWALISSVIGADIFKSWYGNPYRLDGLITVCHLLGVSLIVSGVWRFWWSRRFAWMMVGTSTFLSFWSLAQALINGWYTGVWKGTDIFASGLSFGQPNFLAGYLCLSLPFYLFLMSESKSPWRKHFLAYGMGLLVVAVVMTQSFGSLLGLGLGGAGWWLISRGRLKSTLLLSVVLIVLFTSLAWWRYHGQFVAESRERVMSKIVSGTLERPLSGWGWSNVDYGFRAGTWSVPISNDVYVDKAHSHLLESLATTGIVGLLLYLNVLLIVTKILLDRTQHQPTLATHRLWLLVFIVFFYHSQTNVISINEELLFWVVLGITGQAATLDTATPLLNDT